PPGMFHPLRKIGARWKPEETGGNYPPLFLRPLTQAQDHPITTQAPVHRVEQRAPCPVVTVSVAQRLPLPTSRGIPAGPLHVARRCCPLCIHPPSCERHRLTPPRTSQPARPALPPRCRDCTR